jgi:hypothetical protein
VTTVTLHPGDLVIDRDDYRAYTAGLITWATLLDRACTVTDPPTPRRAR